MGEYNKIDYTSTDSRPDFRQVIELKLPIIRNAMTNKKTFKNYLFAFKLR